MQNNDKAVSVYSNHSILKGQIQVLRNYRRECRLLLFSSKAVTNPFFFSKRHTNTHTHTHTHTHNEHFMKLIDSKVF
jgi:hypothetical protein